MINKSCSTCSGAGSTKKTQTRELKLPSLLEDGMVVQVPIDDNNVLNLVVRVNNDIEMRREGLEIFSSVTISLKDALLGGKVTVPTLHGEKVVTINECTSPNSKLRLKGCGAKHPQTSEFGSHSLLIDIEFPKNLTDDQKLKIEEVFK
jgi:molecular chaperone DnaJ